MVVIIVNEYAESVMVNVDVEKESRLNLPSEFIHSKHVNVYMESEGRMLEACEIASWVVSELGYLLITVDKCVIAG